MWEKEEKYLQKASTDTVSSEYFYSTHEKDSFLYLNIVFSHLLVWISFWFCATLIHPLSNEYTRDITR